MSSIDMIKSTGSSFMQSEIGFLNPCCARLATMKSPAMTHSIRTAGSKESQLQESETVAECKSCTFFCSIMLFFES